jgi:hypothetical protein
MKAAAFPNEAAERTTKDFLVRLSALNRREAASDRSGSRNVRAVTGHR